MQYIINSATVAGDTMNVDVTLTFNDNTTKELTIPVFMPQTDEDIQTACSNRMISEQRAVDAAALNMTIVATVPIGQAFEVSGQ